MAPVSAQALIDAQDLAAQGRGDAALALLGGAVDGDPRATPLLNELAIAAARAERLEEARATLERALATAPVYARLYDNLLAVKQAIALSAYRESLDLPADGDPTLGLRSIPAGTDPVPRIEPPDDDPVDPGPPEAFVRRWADAWQRQDVPAYLDAYVPGYVDAPAGDHASWRALRRERVGGPAFIEIELDGLEVRRPGPAVALVEFDQRYRSDTFADRTRKLLLLRAGPEGWRIQREYSVQ